MLIYIYIGSDKLRIKMRNFNLSPLAFVGYLELDKNELIQHSSFKLVLLYLSGITGNSILILCAVVFLQGAFANVS